MLKKNKYVAFALIIASIWLTYGSTLKHDYAGDDVIVITQNDRVQRGLSDIPSLFKNIKSDQTQHRYGYRPITLLTYAAEVEFFGLNPFWPHFFNLLLYTLLCLTAYHTLLVLFPTSGVWALITLLIFIVHPLHVEVVANIKSRDEILAMLFGLLFLLEVHKWMERKKFSHLSLAILFAILGFLSKENAMGYVMIGGLLPWIKPDGAIKRLKAMAPTFIGVMILIGIYFMSQYNLEANSVELFEQGRYHEDRFVANPMVDYDLWSRVMNAFLIILLSFKLFLFPYPLVHDYGFQHILVVNEFWDYRWLLGAGVLAALFGLGFRMRSRYPQLLFGVGFFIISLALFLHVPIPGPDFFAERFLFGPLLGLAMLIGLILNVLPKWPSAALTSVIVIGCATLTWNRSKDWQSTLTLFEADKEILVDCARFNYNYANHLHFEYYTSTDAQKKKLIPRILHHYERAIKITDRMPVAYLDLGSAYMEFGKPKKALNMFEECSVKYDHLSAPHFQLGNYYMSRDSIGWALQSYDRALERGPSNPNTYYMIAVCEIKLGDLERARSTLIRGREYGKTQKEYIELMYQLGIR